MRVKKIGCLLVLGVALIDPVTRAHAAIPPTEYIIKKIASRRSSTKWIKLTSQVQVALADGGDSLENKAGFARLKVQTLWDQAGRKLKVRVQDEGGTELFAGERALSEESAGSQGTAYGRLVLESSSPELHERFKQFEIPLLTSDELLSQYQTEPERRAAEASSMKRLDGKVAWVIGKPNGPRAWVEKDSHIPMLFEVPAAGGVTRYFRLKSVRVLQDHPFPLSWVLSRGKSESKTGETDQVLIKEDITEALSLNDALATQFSKTTKWAGYTAAGEALPSEIHAAVEKYLSHYR